MRQGLTELVFILDKSGSMGGLESDTIGGYNSMLEKQRNEAGEAIITTVLFDNNYEILHDRINIKGVSPITEREYYIGGSTALLDAIGKTINKIDNVQRHTTESERAEKILFIITTDGEENSSREFSYNKVKQMIRHRQEKSSWEFIFLGANIDAIETASKMGISADMAATYNADEEGIALNFDVMSDAISSFRYKKTISPSWKEKIDRDLRTRKK